MTGPASMSFIVGGFDQGSPYGSVFYFDVPNQPEPDQRNPGDDDFGMTWGGQLEVATRIVAGYDFALIPALASELKKDQGEVAAILQKLQPQLQLRVPYQVLPLQDCIDLATFLIRSTVTAQGLSVGVRGVGGTIEVA